MFKYDVIVVGAGHAGCEAAMATARLGAKTLLASLNLDNIALMPCNPAIGGPAKSCLVREIDALGGIMGVATDATYMQLKTLNSSKGPAVRALRAQSDKKEYMRFVRNLLESEQNLPVRCQYQTPWFLLNPCFQCFLQIPMNCCFLPISLPGTGTPDSS